MQKTTRNVGLAAIVAVALLVSGVKTSNGAGEAAKRPNVLVITDSFLTTIAARMQAGEIYYTPDGHRQIFGSFKCRHTQVCVRPALMISSGV